MAKVSIPVDLSNPGQVFACMGFLEAADVLLGDAHGGFEWTDASKPRFEIQAAGMEDPVTTVLNFLVHAELERLAPSGYSDPQPKKAKKTKRTKKISNKDDAGASSDGPLQKVDTFPAREADYLVLPLRFEANGKHLDVTHFCDGSSRNPFKLFAGQQRSAAIAQQMCDRVKELWEKRRDELTKDPLNQTVPLGGSSFKFDARKAWTAIDAGYSPDEQGNAVEASPVVEILAAIGLEHARPDEFDTRQVRYAIWKGLLPPMLARPVLGGVRIGVPIRVFRFTLDLAGKNKNVTFAEEEIYS